MSPVALHVRDGGGAGPPVVLAHAIGCDHRMWDGVWERLAPRHRLIALDVRGHGRSPVGARPYSLEALAADATGVLDRLGVGEADWVGLSLGGMIGQAFALAAPRRLRRLVLANTTASYGPEGRAAWQARARAVEQGGLEAIRELVMGRYFSEAFRATQPQAVEAIAGRFLTTPVEGYLGCCEAIAGLDFAARLPGIAAPTLVIAGSLDAGTPVAMSEAIAERIPGARLTVIDGAAHLSAVEQPGRFAELVAGFLGAR